ncbi:ead/Ea22-like family protein [Cronobacter sakazakii]
MTDTAKLKAVALAATPGPWRYQKTTPVTDAEISAENHTRVVNLLAGDVTPANSEFIAAANPAAVLELIAALEAAENRNAELEACVSNLQVNRPVVYGDGFYDGYWKARSEQSMSSEDENHG